MPHITIIVDTENPDAYDQLRDHLEANPPDKDDAGRHYQGEVWIAERVAAGLGERRQWGGVYDPDDPHPEQPGAPACCCSTNPGECPEHEPSPCGDRHRPDDDPEPGDRCKDCGRDITWTGPTPYDWALVGSV